MGDFYLQYEYWLAFAQLLLAMLGMGATLTPADFVGVIKTPKSMLIGMVLQMAAIPALAYVMLSLLSVPPGIAVGIAILAAVPGGTTSNIFTYFAKGNIALSIAVTAITTVICLMTVPVVLDLLIGPYVPADFALPTGQIAQEIFVSLLLPLVAGMAALKFAPQIAPRLSKWAIRGSLGVILFMVVGALSSGRLNAEAISVTNIGAVLGLMALAWATGLLVPLALKLPKPHVIAIDMELAVRNVNLGVLIKASLFPAVVGATDSIGDFALFAILLYGGVIPPKNNAG